MDRDGNDIYTFSKVDSGQPVYRLAGHVNAVSASAFSSDGSLVASASWDSTVIVWNLRTQRKEHLLFGHMGWVNALAFVNDAGLLVSGREDHTVRVWNLSNGRPVFVLKNPSGAVLDIAVIGNDTLAIGDRGGTVSFWNLSRQQIVQSYRC